MELPDPHSSPAIKVAGMGKTYGSVEALKGVDLTVPYGTIRGLLGPNGAGKTTLVRLLTTLLRPSFGTASVGGYDVVRESAKLREVIGLAGQYAAVDENLTGRENLTMVGSASTTWALPPPGNERMNCLSAFRLRTRARGWCESTRAA